MTGAGEEDGGRRDERGDDGHRDGSGDAENDDPPENHDSPENDGSRFDRLPATAADRRVPGRASREEVVRWWADRYGVPPGTFEGYAFYEKGAGKIWAYRGEAPDVVAVEGLGLTFLRTRQEHWKPTTDAVQRFGGAATRNVVDLGPGEAARFVAGEDQAIEWDGDWGYLIAAHRIAGEREPLGVGLYLHGELRSTVPKGRRVDLDPR